MPITFARVSIPALLAVALPTAIAAAQCRPARSSNEAKLLAFYSAPISFSALEAPAPNPPGTIVIGGEFAPIPTPSSALEHATECYTASAPENSRLTSYFGRPRLTVTLPMGLAIEASYIPPITIGDAHPQLLSGAVSETYSLPAPAFASATMLAVRVHGTTGTVRGPITCASDALQQTDASGSCWGSQPSNDTFHPYMFGAEAVLGLWSPGGRVGVFAGSGYTWLRPRFQVGFRHLDGVVDNTQIEVDLERVSLLGGVTVRLPQSFALSAEVYSVPQDVTMWRLAGSYRIR